MLKIQDRTRNAPAARAASLGMMSGVAPVPDIIAGSLCAVTLIDRRSGLAARRNGSRLQVLTRNPQAAAAEFLAGRDPLVWDVRIEPLDPARRL